MPQPDSVLADLIRMEALKGFRAPVDGVFGIVNPGDVVEVPRAVAIDLRSANKAIMTEKAVRRQKDYLPERKRIKVQKPSAAA